MRKQHRLFAPAIVLTSNQTAGRGRGTNTWFSNRDCLTVTFAFPVEEHLSPHQLPLAAGLAVRNAAAELTACTDIALKWPNDVAYQDKKLAGLLCERIHHVDLIGVGINVNLNSGAAPRAVRDRLTSLKQIVGRPLDLNTVLLCIARHLRQILSRRKEYPFPAILSEYDRHHALLGRRISVIVHDDHPPVRGRCEGLDQTGRLLLREGKTLHRVIAGHVELEARRPGAVTEDHLRVRPL